MDHAALVRVVHRATDEDEQLQAFAQRESPVLRVLA